MPMSGRERRERGSRAFFWLWLALSAKTREAREEKEIRVGRGREMQDGTRRRNEG